VRIVLITRSTLYKNPGGDTIQILNTQKSLQKLGVEAEIKLSSDEIIYNNYDLLHFFNIIRPADILYHIRKSNKSFVVSTIYVDYSEFDRNNRKGISGLIFRYLPKDTIEYIKVLARLIKNKERVRSYEYFFLGQKRAIKEVIRKSAMLLPNSNNEYKRLSQDYSIAHPYKVIPNAIDDQLFKPDLIRKNNEMVICVARIEGLKNQLNLIKGLNNTKYKLYIIGAPSTNQMDYYKICKDEAGPNVYFISFLKQDELLKYYNEAKVHVLPSWFETTGLSSLEAAAMGCNIVITNKGDAKEYFADLAFYCEPDSPDSIKDNIDAAANNEVNPKLMQKVKEQYIWNIAAKKTIEAYKLSLGIK
jgi:glycosyltransferase involved in cell wall biosynthesis